MHPRVARDGSITAQMSCDVERVRYLWTSGAITDVSSHGRRRALVTLISNDDIVPFYTPSCGRRCFEPPIKKNLFFKNDNNVGPL